ncbi:hypothetical protein QBC42DRAFT_293148 [Cladorrhinum samala]|uniref:Uncharacterized protein n=1 Tax=Cladorrhinum samala TaxID=585594 RepID=A0AAV9I498_9PEZI|nr:hypothetical protein QBC42DRAFT_293148 [Cladorrhinum samala]
MSELPTQPGSGSDKPSSTQSQRPPASDSPSISAKKDIMLALDKVVNLTQVVQSTVTAASPCRWKNMEAIVRTTNDGLASMQLEISGADAKADGIQDRLWADERQGILAKVAEVRKAAAELEAELAGLRKSLLGWTEVDEACIRACKNALKLEGQLFEIRRKIYKSKNRLHDEIIKERMQERQQGMQEREQRRQEKQRKLQEMEQRRQERWQKMDKKQRERWQEIRRKLEQERQERRQRILIEMEQKRQKRRQETKQAVEEKIQKWKQVRNWRRKTREAISRRHEGIVRRRNVF